MWYNITSRAAMFAALRSREEFQRYVPIFRAFYGAPARIFLVRAEGEATVTTYERRDVLDGPDDQGVVGRVDVLK